MNDRFFLDTNVFVYAFDESAPQKSRHATELIRVAIAERNGIVSYQVVQEFFNVARRRFSRPMSTADAEQYLATTFRPLLAIHSSIALYSEALRFSSKYGLSWYDSLIAAAAAEGGCRVLYSEDFQQGQRFGEVRVENPFR
jgi:predicted nucleic acid-binding protein